MRAPDAFVIPAWVPESIKNEAHRLYVEAATDPQYAARIKRLATHKDMRKVWTDLPKVQDEVLTNLFRIAAQKFPPRYTRKEWEAEETWLLALEKDIGQAQHLGMLREQQRVLLAAAKVCRKLADKVHEMSLMAPKRATDMEAQSYVGLLSLHVRLRFNKALDKTVAGIATVALEREIKPSTVKKWRERAAR